MTPGPGIEPGIHWWVASALTTTPSLLPDVADAKHGKSSNRCQTREIKQPVPNAGTYTMGAKRVKSCNLCKKRETDSQCQTLEIMQPVPNAGNRQSVPNAGNQATGAKCRNILSVPNVGNGATVVKRRKRTVDAKRRESCNEYQAQENRQNRSVCS